jgi:hypothetical protein
MFSKTKVFLFLSSSLQLISEINSLKVMELMAPYKIKSMVSGRYLTAEEQGILGLRTGMVITAPNAGNSATTQQWTLAWDPSLDDQYDGYRIESRHEYLNAVTSYYPDGRTRAIPNMWEIIELPEGKRILRNKRSHKCLTTLKSTIEVKEKTCSFKNKFQYFILERLNLDKRIRSFIDEDEDYGDYF